MSRFRRSPLGKLGAPPEIAEETIEGVESLTREVRRRFLPRAVSVTAPPAAGADLTPLLADRPLVGGKPTAYVCRHFACQTPVTEPEALAAQIDEALRT